MFLLYYKDGCFFSKNAENLLSLYNLSFQKIIVSDDNGIRKSLLLNPYYHHTMPAIFFYKDRKLEDSILMTNTCIPEEGNFIGGYDKLNNLMSKILSLTKNNIKQMYEEYKIFDGRLNYVDFLIIAIYVIKIIKKKN
jgi:glutaredoxin